MVRSLDPIDLVLAGPTASGKSALAMEWAQKNEAEIVSADSRQIYREISIGTGKPSRSEQESIPHHMIDLCSVKDVYSAGAFVRDARRAIEKIQSRGKKVVVCGGTGLYIKSLLQGIVDLPEGDPLSANAFRASMESVPTTDLYSRLADVDPERAKLLFPNDRVRILRALFLYNSTGLPPTELYRISRGEAIPVRTFLVLSPERRWLHQAIEHRVVQMLSHGWVEEVEELLSRGGDPSWPGFSSLGYREVMAHLSGKITQEELLLAIVLKTRQYAKRQMTWFRHMEGAIYVDSPPNSGFSWSLLQTMIKS
ncbi:MAG: tRNA (adenosine(37)-N6)-dimethylallyltransferase MiaA [Leptospirillia bacterium]